MGCFQAPGSLEAFHLLSTDAGDVHHCAFLALSQRFLYFGLFNGSGGRITFSRLELGLIEWAVILYLKHAHYC